MTYLILQTLANGRTKHIEVTPELVIDAQQGANYTLIDAETQLPPKNLKIVKKGNSLVIEDDGKELANIDNFFDENSNATFTTDGSVMVSDAAPANVISNQTVIAAAIGDEAVIWSAEASASEGLFGFDLSTIAMAGGALAAGGVSSVNLFGQSSDAPINVTPRALTPTLTLTVGADAATEAEAVAGAINVATLTGETTALTFSNGANSVVVNVVGNNNVQVVALTAADVAALGDGTITVDAVTTDGAGLTATASTTFVLDTTASAAPIISVAAAATNATEGEALAGAVSVSPLNGETTAVTFTGTAGTVTVSVVGTGAAQNVALTLADLTTLGDGSITVDATTTDTAGNVSAAATQVSFILDTIAPTAPTLTVSAANSIASTGEALAGVVSVSPASGESTQVTFTNAAGTPVNVTVVGNGTAQAVSLTQADLTALGDGLIDVNAVTLDVAGNVTTALVSTTFTLDTAPPATPVIALTTDSAIGTDGVTNVGTLVTTGAEVNALVEYSTDGGTTWASAFTAAEGANSVMVRQTDEAGNVSPVSAALDFTFDTQVAAPGVALINDTGLLATDNISSDGALTFTGVEAGALVEYSTDSGATWVATFTPNEGINSVQVRQTDVAGNVSGASAVLTFTLDTAAPLAAPTIALTTDTALADGITSNGALTTTGAEAGALVEYSVDAGATWAATFTAAEGINNVIVRQTDVAGNVSPSSAALTFTLDTLVAVPGVTLSNDTGLAATDNITSDPTLSFTGVEAGALVEYSIDGGTTWTASFTAAEGINSVQIRQTDVAGNVSGASTALNFTLDTAAPVAAPSIALTNDTGLVAADSITNDGALTTSGEEVGALVEYSIDGGTTWAGSFTAAEGANSVMVRQTDVAGNVSPASAALAFTLDTALPATPVIALTTDSGVAADAISNVGTLVTTGAEAGALVEYSIDAGVTWTASFTAAEGANSVMVRQTDVAGNVSPASAALDFTLDTAAAAPTVALTNDTGLAAADSITNDAALSLTGVEAGATVEYSVDAGATWTAAFAPADGTHTVIVRQTDVAGNISAASTPLTFTLDTAIPAAPSVALTTDSGALATDGITNNGAVTPAGVEANALVEYSIDNGATWTASFTAAEGANSVQVRQTDVAGNVSPASTVLAFTLDTAVVAPTVALSNDTGTAADNITSDPALSFTGVEAGALVEYSIDAGTTWSATFTAAEGANSVQVRQTDVAGNVSAASTALAFTLDTIIPIAPVVTLSNDTGTAGDLLTNDGALNVASEAGAVLEYSIDAGVTWTASFTAAEGANTVIVRQTDGAGNVSPASAPLTFTLDTIVAAPTVVLNLDSAAIGDGITNDGQIIVTGNEAAALVEYSIDNGATWTASFTAAEGANSVIVRQTDSAGNISAASAPLAFTLDTQVAAPTLALSNDTGIAGDNITSDAALTITGGETGALIEYSIDAGTTWTTTFTAAEGANSVQVRQTDVAGNVSVASAPLAFTLNTVAGAPTVTLANDTATVGDNITSDGALTVAGTSAGALIEYSLDNGTTWTGTFVATEGANSVIVRQTDLAGNVSANSAALDFTLDTAALAPTIVLANDTALADGISSDGALTVSGVETGAVVEYSIDGGTTWTASFIAAEGANSVQIRQTDVAGNVSPASAALTFTLDTQVAAPSLALSIDSGAAADNISNDGTLSVTGAEAGALVEYSIDAGLTWTASFTATEGANSVVARQTDLAGNVSVASTALDFTLDTVVTAPTVVLNNDTGTAGDNVTSDGALLVGGTETGALIEYSIDAGLTWAASFTAVEGVNDVLVRQTDVASNVSAASAPLNFTLNTAIPGTLSLSLSVDSGVAGDNISNDGALTVTGATAGTTVQYSIDAGLNWSNTFTPVEGANSVIARQTDLAGNVSAASTPFAFTLDTLVTAPSVALLNDTGSLATDNISSDGALNLTGVETGATVEYSIDAGATWTASFTAVEGANSVLVRQTDLTGNVSAASAPLDFTLDTLAPTAPTASVSATNAIATAAEATAGAVDVTALAGETIVVTFSDGATSIPVTVTATGAPQAVALSAVEVASLVNGTITVSAVTTDIAGNTSAAANTSFTLDTAVASVPVLTVSAATALSTEAEAIAGSVTIAPAVGETSVVFFSNGPNIITKTVVGDGTAQAVTLTAAEVATLGDGIIYLSAVNSDLAGNYTSTSATVSFVLDTVAPAAPTLTPVAGADFATAAEAQAGAVTLAPGVGESSDVVFTNGLNSVTVTVVGDGTAQAAVLSAADLLTLGDGTITVDATTSDAAGNVSAAAVQTSFVLDTVAPNTINLAVAAGADFATAAEATAGAVSITMAIGDTTDVIFSNAANGTNVTFTVVGDGTAQVLALTAADLITLGDGSISVNATITDQAGNVSTANVGFVLDSVAPTAPAVTLAAADIGTSLAASGAVSVATVTGETTDMVFSNAVAGTSVTVSLIGDGTTQNAILGAADLATLGDGVISVDASTTDLAGNVSPAAVQSSFNLDTIAATTPVLTVVAGAAISTAAEATAGSVTVSPATGESTDVVFSNALAGSSVTITVVGDGTAQAVVLSAADQATLGDGTISVDATSVDVAGNVSTAALSASFELATTAPNAATLTLVAGADNATAAEATAGAVDMTATAGDSVTINFVGTAGTVTQTVLATGLPQTLTLTAADLVTLGDGAINVDANITDLAGNTTTTNVAFALDTVAATTPVFSVVAGADLATAAEATAGAVTISPAAGESTDVTFSNAAGASVIITIVGDGTAQAVALSAADVALLGDGTIDVNAVSIDLAGNVSAAAVPSSFVLDTVAPTAPTATVSAANVIATAAEAEAGAVDVTAAVGEVTSVVFSNAVAGTSVTVTVTGTGAPQAVALTAADLLTLGDGTISVAASNSDLAGNLATSNANFTLDTAAAALPVLSSAASVTTANAATAVTVAPAVGETTTVVFTNGANAANTTVIKIVIGTGAAQTISLTAADITTLAFTSGDTIYTNAISTDLAGNTTATSSGSFVIDDLAPTVASVTPLDNALGVLATDNIVVTLSENVQAGTGNFVIDNGAGDVRTIDVNDATQVTVAGNTVTINPTGDLVGNSNYSVTYGAGVLTDVAGNQLAAQVNPIAHNFTTAAAVDPTVVVFDLVNGVSSDHSGRVFDANVSYTIHVVVDPAAGAINTAPVVGAVGTFGTWSGAANLGADDTIIFDTSTGSITGALGGVGTVAQPTAVASSLPNASYAWTGATLNAVAAGITELGAVSRATTLGVQTTNLWNGTWAALGDGADAGGFVQATPVGLLTSQGLA